MRVCRLSCFSCVTFYDPVACSSPGSSVHRILQARILQWVAISFSRWSFQPRDQTCLLCLLHWQVGSLPLAPPDTRTHNNNNNNNNNTNRTGGNFQRWCICSLHRLWSWFNGYKVISILLQLYTSHIYCSLYDKNTLYAKHPLSLWCVTVVT